MPSGVDSDKGHVMGCTFKADFTYTFSYKKTGLLDVYKRQEIDVGSAGTAARFLTALLGLSKGRYHIVSSEQMKNRPMKDLLVSLEKLGAHIEYDENEYHFPCTRCV